MVQREQLQLIPDRIDEGHITSSLDEGHPTSSYVICYDWNGGHRPIPYTRGGVLQPRFPDGDLLEFLQYCVDEGKATSSLDEGNFTSSPYVFVGEAGASPHDHELAKAAWDWCHANGHQMLSVDRMAVGARKKAFENDEWRERARLPDLEDDDDQSVVCIQQLYELGRYRVAAEPRPPRSQFTLMKAGITRTDNADAMARLAFSEEELRTMRPPIPWVFGDASIALQKILLFAAFAYSTRRQLNSALGMYEGRSRISGTFAAFAGSKLIDRSGTLVARRLKKLNIEPTDSKEWKATPAFARNPVEQKYVKDERRKVRLASRRLWRAYRERLERRGVDIERGPYNSSLPLFVRKDLTHDRE